MGSRPWIAAFRDRISPDHEGERVVCRRPNGKVIEGIYVGTGDVGRVPHLIISTAPEGMSVRDPLYFAYERWIRIERELTINGVRAPDFKRPTPQPKRRERSS